MILRSSLLLFVLVLQGCSVPSKDISKPLLPGQVYVTYGDTVYSIAERHGVSVRALISMNRLTPPYVIEEGQVLLLPSSSSEDAGESVVQDGPKLLPMEDEPLPAAGPSKPFSVSEEPLPMDAPKPPAAPSSRVDPELLEELESPRKPVKDAVCKPSKEEAPAPCKEVSDELVFQKPVPGKVVREFGDKGEDGKKCQGIRFASSSNESVCASCEGTVLFSGNELGGQNIVVIQHPKGFLTAYGPLQRIMVKKGQKVSKGEALGRASGKSVYFEMRQNRMPINPAKHLP